MSSFIVSAVQLNSQPNLSQNLKQIHHFIEKAVDQKAQLVCLPENFAFYGDDKAMVEQAGQISEQVEKRLAKWAQSFGVYILGGGYPVPAGKNKVYNRSSLFAPNGSMAAQYNKIHLFDVKLSDNERYGESNYTKAGTPKSVTEAIPELGKIGFSICYDLRFPELYQRLAEAGTELLTVPSAFTQTTGDAHWRVLLKARAIENTTYLIAPAQTGTHGQSRKTHGHSMIIDPWGKVLADGGIMPGIITAEIDLDYLKEIRTKLPALRHRVSIQ